MVPEVAERTFIASLHIAQKRAGLGVLIGLHRAFGEANVKLRRYGHHLTHAAYGALASPFDEAVCLVVDGMGETGASGIFSYENGRVAELVRHRGRETVGFYFGLAHRSLRLRPNEGRGMEGHGPRALSASATRSCSISSTASTGSRRGGSCSPTRPRSATRSDNILARRRRAT